MLLSTEPLYHSYPLYQDDNIQFKSLVLTFKRAVNDSNDDTGGVSSNTSKASDSTIMTVHLRNDDTILSISKRIKVSYVCLFGCMYVCMYDCMYVCMYV